ncbi:hypothetical protein [Sorangium sp. So ce590]|uniref:hypothetical protein n=1 Tax=unclassified Sorangium TaxID=2621164 RepID=UPI003F5E921A
MLAVAMIPVGCGAEAPDGADQASDIGSISLALVGTSATGATYRLSSALFNIHGPTHRLFYGDGDATVLTEVLPVGRYDVYLEPGWILERWTSSGYQYVPAGLTSANPTPVFINEGATSTLMFQFRADGDVVSVGQGTLDIVIGVDDTTAPREDTDVACSNGYDDDGDGYADCSDPDCQWQPFCVPWREDTGAACSNGYDDDGDGYADCSDPDCQWQPFCATPGLVIEDFDDGDFFSSPPYARRLPPFTGPWVTYGDGTLPPVDVFPVPGPLGSTALAAYSPGGPSVSGAGVMLSFESWPVNMSGVQGIRFNVRAQGSQVRFEIGTLLTRPEGGFCSDCFDGHGIDLWVGTEWVTVELRWWDLMQQGWGTPAPFEPWAVKDLSWRTPAGQPLGIELDDVQLF